MLEGVGYDELTWMPAQTSKKQVGVLRKGDGQLLTAIDRASNELADKHAKLAVAEHRVPEAARAHCDQQIAVIEDVARWIGHATFSANNQPSHPKRDTAAARPKKKSGTKTKSKHVELRPAHLGGHTIRKFGKEYRCTVCESKSSRWENIAPARCRGAPTSIWQALLNDFIHVGAQVGKGHVQKITEAAIWCTSCGAFESPHGASTKATFANVCKGNPRKWAGPSRCKQLERLRQGIHPTIDIPLGPEITCKSDACKTDHAKLTTEQMARRRAWDKATRRKAVSTNGKDTLEDDGGRRFLRGGAGAS